MDKTEIWVYADWLGMEAPKLIGILTVHQAKGRQAFSFEYDLPWIASKPQILLDPDLGWYSGAQFPAGKENFGIFLDSMPDRWGRTLMKRKAIQLAKREGTQVPFLQDSDYLLGVEDESRMGAIRFKREADGPFLNHQSEFPIPPLSSLRELQHAVSIIESDDSSDNFHDILAILLAPGSSLGGARPKANVYDSDDNLWIAKFPSRYDEIDKGLWEFLVYRLAVMAGIDMAESQLLKVGKKHHTFLTRRFDRRQKKRIHFASAMTMTGYSEELLKTQEASYLDLAEFLQFSGENPGDDLRQLWRRIVFHIAVSNTDDHLRNHGFLLGEKGWLLSPAYDLNPSIDKNRLSLNITENDNRLDLELAMSVGEYFHVNKQEMLGIWEEVVSVVSNWKSIAKEIGIPRKEQEIMAPAFQYKAN